MVCDIGINKFAQKYKDVLSRDTLQRRIESGELFGERKGSRYFVNEKETIKFFNLEHYNEHYKKMKYISETYNVSAKSILDYCRNGKIDYIHTNNKYFINEESFKDVIDTINSNKARMSRGGERKDEMFNRFKNILGPDYVIMGEYKNLKTKIDVLHKICNEVSPLLPDNTIYKNCKCPVCYGTRPYTQDEAEQLVLDFSDGYYALDGEYRSNKTVTWFKHLDPKCKGKNKPYKARLNDFLNNEAHCPYCDMSVGEEIIFNFLTKKSIDFEYQYSISYKDRLFRFDFRIGDIFIEFDGQQHFHEQNNFGDLDKNIERDRLKNEYFSLNPDYTLVRISYKQLKSLKLILQKILIEKQFNDYPLGEYDYLIGNSVILSENIHYIG